MSDGVKIEISAVDKASATLRAIQGEIGRFNKSIKDIATFSLAGIGVQQVGRFLADSVREFGEAEKSQTRLQSVLKATGNTTKLTLGEISEFTDQLEKTTGTSGESLNDAAANLSRFANISGDQFKDLLTLANDMSAVLGTDVTSSVQTLAKALNSPAEGLSRLSRLGVSFNEVQKQQIEMLDQVGMKAEAQAKILDEIRRQFGGAGAEFGKTTAGQLEILNARIGDLKEAIGGSLAPIILDLTDYIKSAFPPDTTRAVNGLNRPIGDPSKMTAGQVFEQFNAGQAALRQAREQEVRLQESMQNRNTFLGDDGAFLGIQLGPTLAEQQKQLDKLQRAIRQAEARQAALAKDLPLDFLDGNIDYAKRLKEAISNSVASAIGGLGGNIVGRATATVAGNVAGRFAAVAAEDAGSVVGRRLYGMLSDQGQQREVERSLQATESRFLTRGRGQLSPEAKKQAEDNAKQLAELKSIRDAIANLGGNVLVVEGVA
jgi:hypothetical protein